MHEEILKATVQKSESMKNLVLIFFLFCFFFDMYKNKLLHKTVEKLNRFPVSSISYL